MRVHTHTQLSLDKIIPLLCPMHTDTIIFKNYNQDPYLDPKLNSGKTLTM